MTSDVPKSWGETYDRMTVQFGYGEFASATAREWVREALDRKWQVQDPVELPRARRAIALQKLAGILLHLEANGDYVFMVGVRSAVAAAFAKYLDGLVLDGPPWAVDPEEHGTRPEYEEWLKSADF